MLLAKSGLFPEHIIHHVWQEPNLSKLLKIRKCLLNLNILFHGPKPVSES